MEFNTLFTDSILNVTKTPIHSGHRINYRS
jgi:hypothetical protein